MWGWSANIHKHWTLSGDPLYLRIAVGRGENGWVVGERCAFLNAPVQEWVLHQANSPVWLQPTSVNFLQGFVHDKKEFMVQIPEFQVKRKKGEKNSWERECKKRKWSFKNSHPIGWERHNLEEIGYYLLCWWSVRSMRYKLIRGTFYFYKWEGKNVVRLSLVASFLPSIKCKGFWNVTPPPQNKSWDIASKWSIQHFVGRNQKFYE